jgi:hypothetical protein
LWNPREHLGPKLVLKYDSTCYVDSKKDTSINTKNTLWRSALLCMQSTRDCVFA